MRLVTANNLPSGIAATRRRYAVEDWYSLRDMTVCIAARSTHLKAIVTISDMMFSTDERSIDSADVKFAALLPEKWLCWYAGDPTVFEELRRRTCEKLDSASTANLADVTAAVEFAYDEALKHRIERHVLAQCGMKHKDFFSDGIQRLGESVFQQLFQEIRYIDVGTELLVVGFDDDGTPHVFSSDKFGACTLRDAESFHAIGSGAFAALGWLHTNDDFRFANDVVHIAYRLVEAKFSAQTSRAVGDTTVLVVMFADGSITGVALNTTSARQAWNSHRNCEPPRDVLEKIEGQLKGKLDVPKQLLAPRSDR